MCTRITIYLYSQELFEAVLKKPGRIFCLLTDKPNKPTNKDQENMKIEIKKHQGLKWWRKR